MKRVLPFCLAALLCISVLAGCKKDVREETTIVTSAATEPFTIKQDGSGLAEGNDGVTAVPPSSKGNGTGGENGVSKKPTAPAPTAAPRATVRVTIPEGFTVAKIANRLEANGICKKSEFLKAAESGNYTAQSSLLAAAGSPAHRAFKLEGYLFPDTYDFYKNEPVDSVIQKMLKNGQNRITSSMKSQAGARGMTMDQIITMASIIQKEVQTDADMKKVASVLYNRIKAGQKLQCDVTINYVEGALNDFISGDYKRFASYYNTYKCSGLPAGAICNPGLQTIRAALNPASTEYLYFAANTSTGQCLYAEDYKTHQENCKKLGVTNQITK